MTEERLTVLRHLVENRNDATLVELCDQFNAATGLKVSRGTIANAVKRLKLSRKKKTLRATERENDPEIVAERTAFRRRMPHRKARQFVFLDETGLHLGLVRLYGRAPIGQRAEGHRPVNWGDNVTLIGGLNRTGVIAPLMFPGSLDGELFKRYVDQILAPQLHPGDTVLLDHLPVHAVKGIAERLARAGATLEFLPRYSPELSPVEHAWSKLKAHLRTAAARNYEALVQAVKDALNKISPNDALHWFQSCGYRIEAE